MRCASLRYTGGLGGLISSLWLLALLACSDDVTVEPPTEPVAAVIAPVEAGPAEVSLSASVVFEAEALSGTPVTEAGYASILAELRKAEPMADRIARVAAIRVKTLQDEPESDGASMAYRDGFDKAVNEALSSFFLAYAFHIIDGKGSNADKADAIQALEAAMMQGWDWNLTSRDQVQAKLMMASRSL